MIVKDLFCTVHSRSYQIHVGAAMQPAHSSQLAPDESIMEEAPAVDVIKVSARSRSTAVAGAIAGVVRGPPSVVASGTDLRAPRLALPPPAASLAPPSHLQYGSRGRVDGTRVGHHDPGVRPRWTASLAMNHAPPNARRTGRARPFVPIGRSGRRRESACPCVRWTSIAHSCHT